MSIWSKLQRLTNCLNLTPRCLDGGVANGSAKMPVQPVHDKIVPLCWVYEKCVLYFVQCTLYNVLCTMYNVHCTSEVIHTYCVHTKVKCTRGRSRYHYFSNRCTQQISIIYIIHYLKHYTTPRQQIRCKHWIFKTFKASYRPIYKLYQQIVITWPVPNESNIILVI